MPRMTGGNDTQLVKCKLRDGRLRQRKVRQMRGVKSPPEKANAQGLCHANQSRGTKKWSVNARSGVPASYCF